MSTELSTSSCGQGIGPMGSTRVLGDAGEFPPEGTDESLIPSAQEKTAQRTRMLLVATRLLFIFSHGALLVSASVHLGWESDASWWTVFWPVWLGDALCILLIIWSWFASCPYIQLCLTERQPRFGDCNPSILTEILPDIVMAIVGLLFMILALVAEIMFCRYLERGQRGEPHSLVPSAVIFILLSMLTCCRGVVISTSGELYAFLGAGVLFTVIAALCVPSGIESNASWVFVLPSFVVATILLVVDVRKVRRYSLILTREERMIRIMETLVMFVVSVALFVLVMLLAFCGTGGTSGPLTQCGRGVALTASTAGVGVCVAAFLRGRLGLLQSRLGSINDRIITEMAAASFPGPQWLPSDQTTM